MRPHSAFAIIHSALEELRVSVGQAVADHAQSCDALASVEYEIEQLRKVIAENALEPVSPVPAAIEPRTDLIEPRLKLAS